MYVHAYMHHAYMHSYIRTYIHTCKHTYICMLVDTCTYAHMNVHTYMYMYKYKLVLKQILKYWNNFGIRMYFLVFDYLFNICACPETKHVQLLRKLNSGGEVSYFVLPVF